MTKTANPFEVVEDAADTEVEFVTEPEDASSLADAAASAFGSDLSELSGVQEELEGTDYTKARFVGMSFDSLDREINIGDEIVFLVKARCLGKGDEASKTDGRIRKYVKMDVQSVVVKED